MDDLCHRNLTTGLRQIRMVRAERGYLSDGPRGARHVRIAVRHQRGVAVQSISKSSTRKTIYA